jgi:phage-related tail fiber protein
MSYYTILTTVGKAKIANAVALGNTVDLKKIAVGDGNGNAVTPQESMTGLTHQVWEADLNSLSVDASNSNWVVATGYIPADVGDFTVREVGIFDADGDMIAIGNYPDTYKPKLDSGSAKDLYLKVILEVSNTSAVTLKVDPAVVLASQDYVNTQCDEMDEKKVSLPGAHSENNLTNSKIKSLLIYYGYPPAYKGLWDNNAVIEAIAKDCDIWVCGDTYQDPSQEVYSDTSAIIAGLLAKGVEVYGYIPIGVNTENRSLATLQTAIDQWCVLNVSGIFVDEFGFDYNVTRDRQNSVCSYIHSKGKKYMANAWFFEDFAADNVSEIQPFTSYYLASDRITNYKTGNPNNTALTRNPDDSFLVEDFCVDESSGLKTDRWDTTVKYDYINQLNALKGSYPIHAIATLPQHGTNASAYIKWDLLSPYNSMDSLAPYVWATATAFGWQSVGIAGVDYGAGGSDVFVSKRYGLSASMAMADIVSHTTYSNNTSDYANWTAIFANGESMTITVDDTNKVYEYTLAESLDKAADVALLKNQVKLLAPLSSPALTGVPTAPTAAAGTNSTQIASTQFVESALSSAVAPLAPLSSPALTGVPTAPTAAAGTNSTQIASTQFVESALAPLENQVGGMKSEIVDVASDTTLTFEDSGKYIYIRSSSKVTLPDPTQFVGCVFRFFITGGVGNITPTIQTPVNSIVGVGCPENSSIYNPTLQSVMTLMSDGTNWIMLNNSGEWATGGRNSLSANGFQYLPGGMIMQWGFGSTDGTVYFPITFPNICLSLTFGSIGINNGVPRSGAPSTSSFHYGSANVPNCPFNYIAIGY